MNTPNWQHHSKKEQKRKLKPQALRARKEALRHFKKRHMNRSNGAVSSYIGYIRNEVHAC
jgi:hypothetical protein